MPAPNLVTRGAPWETCRCLSSCGVRRRGWDAPYVSLSEALGATLLTSDGRLGRVCGLHCDVEVVGDP